MSAQDERYASMENRLADFGEPTPEPTLEPTPEPTPVRRSLHARMAPVHPPRTNGDGRSVVELLRQLSTESGTLVRQEVELAKAEMREKMGVFQQSMASIGIGSALLVAALLIGLWALNAGFTALLAQMLPLGVAVWLSPLILTVALAAIGWSLIQKGKTRMAEEGLVPRRTTSTLKDDKRWAEAKMHEIKEELRHGR